MKKLSIVTPCFNEEEGLYECCKSIKNLFETDLIEYDYEHIICDNNSNEKTIKILREISSKDNKVKVILNAKNYGSAKSTFNGIKNSSGDAVLLSFPVDMQDPVEKIPEMVKAWNDGYDFVVGCRDQREEHFFMKTVRSFYYILLKKISMTKIPRNAGEFQLVDRKIINKILEMKDSYPFLRTLAFEYSENFKTISYNWKKRKIGSSKEQLKSYVNTAMHGLISVTDAPFRLILIVGFLISFLSIGYGLYTFFDNFFFENQLEKGIPTILVSILIFSGLQLLVLGFIGEYISSIHKHIKKNIDVNEKEKINF